MAQMRTMTGDDRNNEIVTQASKVCRAAIELILEEVKKWYYKTGPALLLGISMLTLVASSVTQYVAVFEISQHCCVFTFC